MGQDHGEPGLAGRLEPGALHHVRPCPVRGGGEQGLPVEEHEESSRRGPGTAIGGPAGYSQLAVLGLIVGAHEAVAAGAVGRERAAVTREGLHAPVPDLGRECFHVRGKQLHQDGRLAGGSLQAMNAQGVEAGLQA